MDQSVIATAEFLNSQILKLQETLQMKDEHIQRLTQRSYADSADRNRMVEAMQEWTLEALQARDISETNAEEIAEIMGFDLSKEVEVEVTVTYNLTVMVPHDEDVESIVNDIDFETINYNDDYITYFSASVDRIDI
jgi:hypothetical protein